MRTESSENTDKNPSSGVFFFFSLFQWFWLWLKQEALAANFLLAMEISGEKTAKLSPFSLSFSSKLFAEEWIMCSALLCWLGISIWYISAQIYSISAHCSFFFFHVVTGNCSAPSMKSISDVSFLDFSGWFKPFPLLCKLRPNPLSSRKRPWKMLLTQETLAKIPSQDIWRTERESESRSLCSKRVPTTIDGEEWNGENRRGKRTRGGKQTRRKKALDFEWEEERRSSSSWIHSLARIYREERAEASGRLSMK